MELLNKRIVLRSFKLVVIRNVDLIINVFDGEFCHTKHVSKACKGVIRFFRRNSFIINCLSPSPRNFVICVSVQREIHWTAHIFYNVESTKTEHHCVFLENQLGMDGDLQRSVSISDKTSYRKISWSLEATRLVVSIIKSLWSLTYTSAVMLPMCV